jgi:AraC-like DNA-binding protein
MTFSAAAFAGPFRVRDVRYDQNEVHPRHGHDVLQIGIILRGAVGEESRGVIYRGSAGDIVVKPAGTMHANTFNGVRIVSLDCDPALLEVPLTDHLWHRSTAATAAALRLVSHFLDGTLVAETVDDLLGALPSPITSNRLLAARAGRLLEECFTEPLSVERVAQILGVHRVYLARVFRLQWRCSPREYVRHLRVRAAAHALASTRRPLSDIAFDSGFSDQAYMSRTFARTVGITPAAFRRLTQA